MPSYRRADIDRGRRPLPSPRRTYRVSPYPKGRDDRSERTGYRDDFDRSSRQSLRNERSYESTMYSPASKDPRDRFPADEREKKARRSISVTREEWDDRYLSRDLARTRNIRGDSRDRTNCHKGRKDLPAREWNRSPHGRFREYQRTSHNSRSPGKRSTPEHRSPVRKDRRERISPYRYKCRERGRSQPPPCHHKPPPTLVPSLMDKNLTESIPKCRDWRISGVESVDPMAPVHPRLPVDQRTFVDLRKRPSKVLLPTPEEPPSALFAELVYTGAKIVSAKLNGSANRSASNGRSGKRTLLPLPLPPDDLRNRLDPRTGLIGRSSTTPSLSPESNVGLTHGIPNGCGLEDAKEKSVEQSTRLVSSESSASRFEPTVTYQSQPKMPTLVPIIKREMETSSEGLSEYDGISKQFLFCHLCIKHLADGMSFESHLTDLAHVSLVESFELNYKLQLDVLRHNARLEKQRRDVETGRSATEPLKCSLCDVNFDGSILVHRKSIHHQRLKRFLNPSCRICRQEFGSRIERDYHRLSAEHLKALQNQERSLAYEDDDHEVDELQTVESLDTTVASGPHQSPDHVTDEDAIGHSAIQRVAAFYCRLCHKQLLTRSEAYDDHCKTKCHRDQYQSWLNNRPAIEAA